MKEYHDHEQRLIYKKCPGCRADLELDADECLFCDHSFQQEEVAEFGATPQDEVESKTSSLVTMVALNVVIGLAGAAFTSWERKPETPTYRHPPRVSISVKDRELFTRFFKEHGKSIPAEIRTQLEPIKKNTRVNVISVTFSNNSRGKISYTNTRFKKRKADDLLERFRIPTAEK
ncbi:hypothetical protein [Gimesia fumaroli]|jgi:hypothetical protein|uniref:Uncharacterized protein n=1 Tax=Gimesia fumaroli TaxID=2527976 RepID=A0A518IBI3_9PLAN|nr:hypothetical protein [Gimesia fumaroli]QDV50467.1 hypothetical protein Enr17x_25070 [Gimesia fumaroli]